MLLKGLTTLAAPVLQASLASHLGSIYRIARSSEYTQQLSHAFQSLDMRAPGTHSTIDLQHAAQVVEQDLSLELSRYHGGVRQQPHPSHWHVAMTRMPTLVPALSNGDSKVLVNEVLSQGASQALAQGAEASAAAMAGFAMGETRFEDLERQLTGLEFKMNLDLLEAQQGVSLEAQETLAFSERLMPMTFSPVEFVLKHCNSTKARLVEQGIQALQSDAMAHCEDDYSGGLYAR